MYIKKPALGGGVWYEDDKVLCAIKTAKVVFD